MRTVRSVWSASIAPTVAVSPLKFAPPSGNQIQEDYLQDIHLAQGLDQTMHTFFVNRCIGDAQVRLSLTVPQKRKDSDSESQRWTTIRTSSYPHLEWLKFHHRIARNGPESGFKELGHQKCGFAATWRPHNGMHFARIELFVQVFNDRGVDL